MKESNSLRVRVLLTLQVALLGEITEKIRGVACSWNDRSIKILVVHTSTFNCEDKDEFDSVEAEMMSSFPDHEVSTKFLTSDFPEKFDLTVEMAWVFLRKWT